MSDFHQKKKRKVT